MRKISRFPVEMLSAAKPAAKDVFEKCVSFTRPQELQAIGLYNYFSVFGDRQGCGPGEICLGDRKVLMFGSNDYLDLTVHPRVKQAAAEAALKYGSGCSGSRLLNGTLEIHVKLEEELAAFMRKDAAILFGTGFQANYAVLSALADSGDVLICEHNLHASLVDGALSSRARTLRFRHNDMAHLEQRLQQCSPEEGMLIVTESIFSMEGDTADLANIARLATLYGARTYVDEAHGMGLFGPTGAGVAEQEGVLESIDIVMGTFSKSLAAAGGFVASSNTVINYLKHLAHPFVFSASIPPASVEAVRTALQILKAEPERRRQPLVIAEIIRRELCARGFSVRDGNGPIVPVVIAQDLDLLRLGKALLEAGIYVNPVLRPAATQNLLRISCTAAHTEAHARYLVDVTDRLARELNIEFESAAPIEAVN